MRSSYLNHQFRVIARLMILIFPMKFELPKEFDGNWHKHSKLSFWKKSINVKQTNLDQISHLFNCFPINKHVVIIGTTSSHERSNLIEHFIFVKASIILFLLKRYFHILEKYVPIKWCGKDPSCVDCVISAPITHKDVSSFQSDINSCLLKQIYNLLWLTHSYTYYKLFGYFLVCWSF